MAIPGLIYLSQTFSSVSSVLPVRFWNFLMKVIGNPNSPLNWFIHTSGLFISSPLKFCFSLEQIALASIGFVSMVYAYLTWRLIFKYVIYFWKAFLNTNHIRPMRIAFQWAIFPAFLVCHFHFIFKAKFSQKVTNFMKGLLDEMWIIPGHTTTKLCCLLQLTLKCASRLRVVFCQVWFLVVIIEATTCFIFINIFCPWVHELQCRTYQNICCKSWISFNRDCPVKGNVS